MRIILFLFLIMIISGCASKSLMVVSPTGDGKYWVLQEKLEYEHPVTKELYVIPRGFVTDLASVPRLFWTAFPPCGKYTIAAVLHDYLYWVQQESCDRECADNILLLAMEEARVNLVTRNSIYAAVRLGGQGSWSDNQKLKSAGGIRVIPEEYMHFGAYDSWEKIQEEIRKAPLQDENTFFSYDS